MSKFIPEKEIIAALRKWGGIPSLAAKELGTSRQNIYLRVKTSKKLQDALKDIEDENLDIGEGHVVKGLRDGDKDYVKYYLDRKGKKRGYGNSAQITIDFAEIDGWIAAFGGNLAKLRAWRDSLPD